MKVLPGHADAGQAVRFIGELPENGHGEAGADEEKKGKPRVRQ